MKILFFMTGHRQLEEYQIQKSIFEKFPDDIDHDLIVHSNSSIPASEIEKRLQGLRSLKKVCAQMPNKGYATGHFHALKESYAMFTDYDYVIHLHPDVFVIDSSRLFSGVKVAFDWGFDFYLSYMLHVNTPSGLTETRNINGREMNIYYHTDMFGFNPKSLTPNFFNINSNDCAEWLFTRAVSQSNKKVYHHERLRPVNSRMSFMTDERQTSPDSCDIWHSHDLAHLRNALLLEKSE